MAATLRLRKDKLASYRRIAGITTDHQFAQRLGMDPSSVSRILAGTQVPGAKFIAELVDLFGVDLFPDLFEVVSDEREVIPA